MKRQQQLLGVLAAVALLGVMIFGYRFFLKERLQKYAENEGRKKQLTQKLDTLEGMFSVGNAETTVKGIDPEVLTSAYRAAIQPWADAVDQRAKYFNIRESGDFKPIPDDGLAKFVYESRYNEMLQALQMEAYRKGTSIPSTNFGVPSPDSLRSQTVSVEQANGWLRRLALGIGFTRVLIQQGLNPIREIVLWPPLKNKDVEFQTVGVSFVANMDTLTKFLNYLKTQDRYSTVNALRVTNQNLYYADPLLEVQMVFTMGEYVGPPPSAVQAAAEAEPTQGGASDVMSMMKKLRMSISNGQKVAEEKRPWWKAFWPF